jgi:hypothetical protein
MSDPELLYSEHDIEKFTASRRFLAAAHAYSMDMLPLGEAIVRASTTKPYYPNTLEIIGYVRLFHEVAERIHSGKIRPPDGLRQEWIDIYEKDVWDPEEKSFFSDRDFMKFSEIRSPERKKKILALFKQQFNDEDVEELIKNRKLLAAVDAYGRGLIDLKRLKEYVFGDFNANPRDLSFTAFQRLCFELVRRIQGGLIQLPHNVENEFSEIYRPPGAKAP